MKSSRKSSKKKSSKTNVRKTVTSDVSKQEPPHAVPSPVVAEGEVAPPPPSPKVYRMQVAAGRMDESRRREIVGMWVSAGILPREEAERRVNEVIIEVRTEKDFVVGVTTAYPVQVPNVGVCWFLRMFLLPEHRGFLGKNGLGLPSRMLGATMAFLAQRSEGITPNRPVGAVMVLENKKFHSPRWRKAFETNGWQFAGTAPNGCPALFHPFAYHLAEGGKAA
jgi:hypothetical protein